MAEPNFELINKNYALSPMVLRAKTTAGKSLTLHVGDTSIILTSDKDGNVVYDIAPLLRDMMRRKFSRGNLAKNGYSCYGLNTTVFLDNTYKLFPNVAWARASAALIDRIDSNPYKVACLLPSGKYVYRDDNPVNELLSLFSINSDDNTLYAKNKKTGYVYELGDFVIEKTYNVSARQLFGELPCGDYTLHFVTSNAKPFLDVTVTDDPFPTEAVRDGSLAYVRYCNRCGGISYALLQVTSRTTKNKNTYIRSNYALDAGIGEGMEYSVYPDRMMTGQEITDTFKAGKDQLAREELEDLKSIPVSPMVDVYDAAHDEWVPVYPSDATVTDDGGALQEITIEFEYNTEGF